MIDQKGCCPNCGAEKEHQRFQCVNVVLETDLQEKVDNYDLFIGICPNCGSKCMLNRECPTPLINADADSITEDDRKQSNSYVKKTDKGIKSNEELIKQSRSTNTEEFVSNKETNKTVIKRRRRRRVIIKRRRTRDLLINVLKNIGYEPELEETTERIKFTVFSYGYIYIDADNRSPFITIWNMNWAKIGLDNPNLNKIIEIINQANIHCMATIFYSIDEEEKVFRLHCKREIPFVVELPDIEAYLSFNIDHSYDACADLFDRLKRQNIYLEEFKVDPDSIGSI